MKKIIFAASVSLFICAAFTAPIFNSNTEKPRDNFSGLITDPRDAYVGAYFCQRSTTSFRLDRLPDVVNDTLTMNVSKDAVDSVLLIANGNNSNKFKLKNGILNPYPEGERRSGKFFASDSIRLIVGLGRASSASYIGKKK